MKIKNLVLISIFLVIAILFVPNIVKAADGDIFDVDGNSYKIISETNKEIEFSRYKGEAQEFVIPQEVTNETTNIKYKVTSIGNSAFYFNKTLKNVEIPNTIVSIGDSAFYNCENLTSLELPDSVRNIGRHAFRLCTKVESIKIPEGVEVIEDGVFEYCYSLKEIHLPSTLTTIKDMMIQGCKSLESLEIPSSVNSLGDFVFIYSGLLDLHFKGDKPATIGTELFKECKEGLTIYVPMEYYDSYKNAFSDVNVSYCKVETKDNIDTYTIYRADGKNITFDVTNGIDGVDGENGKDGIDGTTPKLQINSKGELEVSYDEGKTWTSLGKVVGEDGKNGTDGKDGSDGKDGKDGADGKNGTNGKDGKDATSTTITNGKDGADGKDGITPKLQINSKGELEVSYDDGETWNSLGKVVGTDGKTEVIEKNEASIKYGIKEYIICALAVLGNIGWIVALKRRK